MALRVILIGGTSHLGKSTVAAELAGRLGWAWRSTDSLARHPGRPWRRPPEVVPPHVVEHYLGLAGDELLASVQDHYQRLWPTIAALIDEAISDPAPGGLVLEGSALWPDEVAGLDQPNVAAIWLTAPAGLLEGRMRRGSRYDGLDPAARTLVDRFLDRAERFDHALRQRLAALDLPSLEVREAQSPADLAEAVLSRMRPLG